MFPYFILEIGKKIYCGGNVFMKLLGVCIRFLLEKG
jgi:hypothetical protein